MKAEKACSPSPGAHPCAPQQGITWTPGTVGAGNACSPLQCWLPRGAKGVVVVTLVIFVPLGTGMIFPSNKGFMRVAKGLLKQFS